MKNAGKETYEKKPKEKGADGKKALKKCAPAIKRPKKKIAK